MSVLVEREGALALCKGVASIDELIAKAKGVVAEELVKHPTGKIGKRETPIFSEWPMRPKWEKFGRWWTALGTDGVAEFVNGVGIQIPAVLQLFYIKREDGMVEQLVWEREDLTTLWREYGYEPSLSVFGENFIMAALAE